MSKNNRQSPSKSKLERRGVSLSFLLSYASLIRQHLSQDEFNKVSTKDIVHGIGVHPESELGGTEYSAADTSYTIRGLTRVRDKHGKVIAKNMVNFLEDKIGTDLSNRLKELGPYDFGDCMSVRIRRKEHDHRPWFGNADFFVSHAWSRPFVDLIKGLANKQSTGLENDLDHWNTYFWIDVFAVNQHYFDDAIYHDLHSKERNEELANFENVVKMSTRGIILFMSPLIDPELLKRTWCWHEVSLAILHKKSMNLALTAEDELTLDRFARLFEKDQGARTDEENKFIDNFINLFENFNLESSQTTLMSDKIWITEQIENNVTSEKINSRVKVAIARLLMSTIDKITNDQNASCAVNLFVNLTDHLGEKERSSSAVVNPLVRVLNKKGFTMKALNICRTAVEFQDSYRDKASIGDQERKELELDFAINLNSLGRIYGDMENKTMALKHLERALEIRENLETFIIDHETEGVHEVMYNIGRAIVMYYENSKVDITAVSKTSYDLRRAKQLLKQSIERQQNFEATPGSLGSCYVFYAKIKDMMDDDKREVAEYFQKGLEIQIRAYRRSDRRVFLTMTDFGTHLLHRGDFEAAWEKFAVAHNGLLKSVKSEGINPYQVIYCIWCLKKILDQLRKFPEFLAPVRAFYQVQDVISEKYIESEHALARHTICFINWMRDSRHEDDRDPDFETATIEPLETWAREMYKV
mmetsp:Transcript_5126/g.6698  ORF Transcript_5126/g.6698 Transcript_5126/m.6698 type:complete len:700 (+) Transcript_5126:91-2190(+)|eukprot:CAMPEP_0204872604 /NCGR_PEP_ID=MMETSP1348-20121228/38408_1 /ASSEMBLY_ACC=CAM_ASM_000700 /TAXON_ID=215587 /ORGANISM="Aplanochytrium stocchinoi, Strain GSBS06" /LENGTH=699 /DNA_ID=CAMNT_0052027503 /DNA_START=75 /DNA_END=2174 /DNA_ORIENTATION=-